jgi:IS30 family transposase
MPGREFVIQNVVNWRTVRGSSSSGKLRLDWSPEQIAGWLRRTHPEDGGNQVSHETIYRSLLLQTRGVLKNELLSHLRSKRSMRRSRPADQNGDRRGISRISSQSVSDRRRFGDRAVPGHWERDLLSGPKSTCIFATRKAQRGSNENTNGVLRQYFPKGTDLSLHSQAHLNKVARQLTERRRQTLQFETPAVVPTFQSISIRSPTVSYSPVPVVSSIGLTG